MRNSKNSQTPKASPFGKLPITTPTKERDINRPEVLSILNNNLCSLSRLLAYSSMNAEDILVQRDIIAQGDG